LVYAVVADVWGCPAVMRRGAAWRARFAARARGPLTPAAPDVGAQRGDVRLFT